MMVEVDAASCTMCESCAKACPTNALLIERRGDVSELSFDPMRCVGCGVCVNSCPEEGPAGNGKAISLRALKEGDALSPRPLARDEMLHCVVCGAPIGSRRSIEHVRAVMRGNGLEPDDGWLMRCPAHRAEYMFSRQLGAQAKFRPRR